MRHQFTTIIENESYHLIIENEDHTDLLIIQYLREYGEEICPDDGNISYVDGEPGCIVHLIDEGNEEDEGVRYL